MIFNYLLLSLKVVEIKSSFEELRRMLRLMPLIKVAIVYNIVLRLLFYHQDYECHKSSELTKLYSFQNLTINHIINTIYIKLNCFNGYYSI